MAGDADASETGVVGDKKAALGTEVEAEDDDATDTAAACGSINRLLKLDE